MPCATSAFSQEAIPKMKCYGICCMPPPSIGLGMSPLFNMDHSEDTR